MQSATSRITQLQPSLNRLSPDSDLQLNVSGPQQGCQNPDKM